MSKAALSQLHEPHFTDEERRLRFRGQVMAQPVHINTLATVATAQGLGHPRMVAGAEQAPCSRSDMGFTQLPLSLGVRVRDVPGLFEHHFLCL